MKTILAPVDFSPVSDAVVTEAVTLARALRARIVLLSVVQPPVIMSDYGPLMENIVEIVAVGEKATAKRLKKLRDQIATRSLKVETELATGAPVPAITDAAKKLTADYIVMGSHDHIALYDLVVGSTTHGVLKHAQCPVIIIPAHPSQPAKPPASPAAKSEPRSRSPKSVK